MSDSVQDINPADIHSFKPTEAMARGERELETPGLRASCTISRMEVYPPSEQYPKEGCVARIKFTFSVDGSDEILVKRIDFYQNLRPGQKMYELLNAVWGQDMSQHTLEELEGRKISIYIKHTMNKQSKKPYADFNYDPVS